MRDSQHHNHKRPCRPAELRPQLPTMCLHAPAGAAALPQSPPLLASARSSCHRRIDAIMAQLRQQGWMHHLARHSVACFLTRGDLWCRWACLLLVRVAPFRCRWLGRPSAQGAVCACLHEALPLLLLPGRPARCAAGRLVRLCSTSIS